MAGKNGPTVYVGLSGPQPGVPWREMRYEVHIPGMPGTPYIKHEQQDFDAVKTLVSGYVLRNRQIPEIRDRTHDGIKPPGAPIKNLRIYTKSLLLPPKNHSV